MSLDFEVAEGSTRTMPSIVRDPAKFTAAREQGWVDPQPASLCNVTDEPVWAHKAARYEWSDEYGDVGPENPELELQLFHDTYRTVKGIQFDKLLSIKVTAEATERPEPVKRLTDCGLHPIMAENVRKCGYDIPTPIQAYVIPAILKGRDVIATAQTGSGKTAAFFIPVLSKLMGKAKKLAAPRPNLANAFDPRIDGVKAEPLVLVVAPTRELCIQIFDEARRLSYRSMLRPALVYGGGPVREQKDELRKGCDILVATPGRLKDFLVNDPSLLSLSRLRYTIIDEADEMLQDDWQEELEAIFSRGDASMDSQHQYLLFSATFDKNMRRVAKNFLATDHVRIRIGRAGSTHMNIRQQIIYVDKDKKKEALYDLLIASPPARTLVFVRSKKMADFVDDFLFNQGLPTTSLTSDRTQKEREDSIRAFKNGSAPIMIATNISGRGLDIRNIMQVINFDLPLIEHNGLDEYVHRIGRTGRIGNQGLATSFYNEGDEPMAPFLVKLLLESGQPVPDFLEHFKPEESTALDFEDDSGDEENDNLVNRGGNADVGDSW